MADDAFNTTTDKDLWTFQAVTQIANALAIANYHNFAHLVAPKLISMLVSDDRVWRLMRHDDALSIFYPLSLALRSKELFIQTMLHAYHKAAFLRSKGPSGDYELVSLAATLGMSVDMLQLQGDIVLKERNGALKILEQQLRNIIFMSLQELQINNDPEASIDGLSLGEPIEERRDTPQSKEDARAEHLSRHIWGQTITKRLDITTGAGAHGQRDRLGFIPTTHS